MSECCGKPCDTPFCPMCGKRLSEYFLGIQGLKRHVDGYVKSLAASLEELPSGEWSDKKEKRLDKWKGWQSAVKELMDDASKQNEG